MARPHIEFVQAQHLSWEPFASRPGVAMKPLSQDPQTGALSAILRYPAGWRAAAGTLATDEEFFVLDGALDHGGTDYGADCYALWPRSFPRQALSAPSGTTVLTCLSAPAELPVPLDPARLTERIDCPARRVESRSGSDGAGGDGGNSAHPAAPIRYRYRRDHLHHRDDALLAGDPAGTASGDPGDLLSSGRDCRSTGDHAGGRLCLAGRHRDAWAVRLRRRRGVPVPQPRRPSGDRARPAGAVPLRSAPSVGSAGRVAFGRCTCSGDHTVPSSAA